MSLYNVGNEQPIVGVPRMFASDFKRLQDALTQAEFQGVIDRINELIDAAGAEIATAGWLPGSNWEGTALHPIFSKAARKNQALAGKLFGLCVWYAVTQRPEDWSSGRYQKNGRIGHSKHQGARTEPADLGRRRIGHSKHQGARTEPADLGRRSQR